MKILFVVENYYPKMSGVPVVVRYLAEGLAKRRHEVHLITRKVDFSPSYEELNEVKIHRFNINYTYSKRLVGDKKIYRDFVRDGKFDVIILECSQCSTTDLLLPILSNIKAVKIFHSHGFSGLTLPPFKIASSIKSTVGNSYNYFFWKWYYSHTLKKYLNNFDVVFCLSEVDSSKKYLDRYFKKEVKVISNAAEDVFFENIKRENITAKYIDKQINCYCVSVANYNEYKNQIGILREFYKSNKKLSLIFCGSKKTMYYNSLLKEKEKLDMQFGKREVYFLTGVERKDIPSLIANAKLYLVGSTFEEFSISLIESMALGVPFISTNVGNAKVLPGGITLPSIDMMNSVIDDMILDEEKYKKISILGKKYAREFCMIDSAVTKLEEISKKVMEGN